MPGWAWALIAIAAVIVIGLILWQVSRRRRSHRLRERFGPEYERTVQTTGDKTDAEKELAARERRRRRLQLRPLSQSSHDRYVTAWRSVQAQFVDSPAQAVAAGDSLIQAVMAERGYPVEDFEQRVADISVDHPDVVQNYREARRLADMSASGQGSTEDLRQAMSHQRLLFEELVEPPTDRSVAA